MIKLFRNYPLFLRFWIAAVASQLASRMHSLILIWLVYKWSHSASIVGIAMISASLPSVLISPLAGSIVDRHNKIVLMYIADFIRMLTVLVFAYLFFEGALNTMMLIVGTMVISIASAFFNPASMSVLPQLVKKEDITKANATGQISGSVSSILGPLFGSALIALLGVVNAFLATGIFFLISVVFLAGIKAANSESIERKKSILSDIKNGFSLIKKYDIVHKMLSKVVIINFFFSSLIIVVPILAKDNATHIAYLMSTLGAGMLFSSLIFSSKKMDIRPTYFLLSCLIFMGFSFMSLGFLDNFYIHNLSMFIIGAVLSGFNIVIISIYQTKLPQENLGKFMALITAISISLQPISYGVMGIFIDWIGIEYMLLISGVVIASGAFGILRIKNLDEV